MQQQRKRENVWRQRPLRRVKNQMRGHQQDMWCEIWMLRQWGNLGWVLNGLYCIVGFFGWIVSYRLDYISGSYCIGWIGSYCIVLARSGNTEFYALAGYWLDGTDRADVLDGALVGRGWDGRMLAPAGSGDPPWATKQELHRWLLRGGDALAGYWLDGTDGTDRLDGALVGRGWDGRKLAPDGMGAPPWAPEQERHRWLLRGSGLCEVVAGTNCVSAARGRSICVGEAK